MTDFRFYAGLFAVVWAVAFQASAGALLDVERLVQENEGCVLVISGKRAATGADVQSSGCCIDPNGYVLATAHQVDGVEQLKGRDHEGAEYQLKCVKVLPEFEISLLKTQETVRHWARLGDASTLRSGAPLISIAAPTSLDFSTVTGVVSNTSRTYRGHPVIQADLPASPGSSGGPVFDRNGLLTGLIIGKLEEQQWVTVINPVNNAFPLLRGYGIPVPGSASAPMDGDPLIPAPDLTQAEKQAVEAYNRGVGAPAPAEKAKAYQTAVQLLPAFYEAWFNLGVAAAAGTDFNSARMAYREAEKLRPEATEVQRNLGRLELQEGRSNEAIACFQKAAALAPNVPQSFNDLGEAYRRAGQVKPAVEAFEKAISIDPKYGQAHYNLGLTYANAGAPNEAIPHFDAYLRICPDASDKAEVLSWIEKLRATS